MKKVIGIILAIILIFLGGTLGYTLIYKATPRDFITEDTRIVYANENIKNKDFTPILYLLDDDEVKDTVKKDIKNLRYLSKFYLFSDKEFYEINEKSFTAVVDPGYWYFTALKSINKYFHYENGIYILKDEYRKKYLPKIKSDIFMKNYRGLFIVSLGEKNIKDFIAKARKSLYNKEMERELDMSSNNLFGTLIYNNKGNDFYGVELLSASADLNRDKAFSIDKIYINEKESEILKTDMVKRELTKYVKKNDIYFSVNDFSKLDKIIFNSLITRTGVDSRTMLSIWKNIFGIDIEEILKEIDGEIIFRPRESAIMVKLKENTPEISRLLSLLKDKNSAFFIENNIELNGNILKIGNSKFEENLTPYKINSDTFCFGEITSEEFIDIQGIEGTVRGESQIITIESEMSIDILKKLINGY